MAGNIKITVDKVISVISTINDKVNMAMIFKNKQNVVKLVLMNITMLV